jgi:hypothetical protein
MVGGAPHGESAVQYECRDCTVFLTSPQEIERRVSDYEIREALDFGRYFGGRP